jgi:hypothetical protein
LVETGGRLIKHTRQYWLLLAESHLTWRLFVSRYGGSTRWRWRPGSRRAVTPAKSGDQDVEVGDLFMEITEKMLFPGFRFFRRGEIGVSPSQETRPGEKVPKNCGLEINSWHPVII